MQYYRTISALALTGALAGCSGGTGTLGPGTTFAQLAAKHDANQATVDNILNSEGFTTVDELPDTPAADTATYAGTMHGTPNAAGTGPDVTFYAELTMDANFDSGAITGTISNVKTDLTGFTSPSGTATLNGNIVGGTAEITAGYSGVFQQGDNIATLSDGAALDGDFVGDNADAAQGDHFTDFEFTAGDYTGTSFSDGQWYLLKQ